MFAQLVMTPIGTVHTSIAKPVDDVWGNLISRIDVDAARFTPESLAGLREFSHVEIVFLFDQVAESDVQFVARRPRGNAKWPVTGIFAQRGKNRPNRIGVTVCRLRSVEGLSIWVEELDAIERTPVLDIKPYMREFGPRGEVLQPRWATELMEHYWGNSTEES